MRRCGLRKILSKMSTVPRSSAPSINQINYNCTEPCPCPCSGEISKHSRGSYRRSGAPCLCTSDIQRRARQHDRLGRPYSSLIPPGSGYTLSSQRGFLACKQPRSDGSLIDANWAPRRLRELSSLESREGRLQLYIPFADVFAGPIDERCGVRHWAFNLFYGRSGHDNLRSGPKSRPVLVLLSAETREFLSFF
jgi:hypothetical protein